MEPKPESCLGDSEGHTSASVAAKANKRAGVGAELRRGKRGGGKKKRRSRTEK